MAPSDDDDPARPDVAGRLWIASSEQASGANPRRGEGRGEAPLQPDADAGAEPSVDEVTLPGADQRATSGVAGFEPSDDEITVPGLLPAAPLRRLGDDEVLQLAEGIRAETGVSHQDDPRGLAFRLGIDVVPGFPEAGEKSTATEAVFSWHRDPRERGIRICCALVQSFFLARHIAHGPGDVWALAVELALPMRERWVGRLTLSFTLRFCPESVIRAYVPAV